MSNISKLILRPYLRSDRIRKIGNKIYKGVLVFTGLILTATFTTAIADSQPNTDKPVIIQKQEIRRSDEKLAEVADRAQRLMQRDQFQRAADYLENLSESESSDISIQAMLELCYEKIPDYQRLIDLLTRRMNSQRPTYLLMHKLGKAHLLAGNTDSTRVYFLKSMQLSDGNEEELGQAALLYDKYGHYGLEIEFIDSSRAIFADEGLMSERMGDALTAKMLYGLATLEYLRIIDDLADSQADDSSKVDASSAKTKNIKVQAKRCEDKIVDMIRFPESVDTVMSILTERISERGRNDRLLKIFGTVLMTQGKYDEAWDFFREQDSLKDIKGADIIFFMRGCLTSQRFTYVVTAGTYLIRKYPQADLLTKAHFNLAKARLGLGHIDQALASYDYIIDISKRKIDLVEAKLLRGMAIKDNLSQLDRAKNDFLEVIQTAPGSAFEVRAKFGLADLFVMEDKLDSAMAIYDYLQGLELGVDRAELAEFESGRLYIYQEKYKEAEERFRRLINRYPRGFFVNDAIQYSLILGEIQDQAAGQADLFSRAEYYRHTGKADSLEYYLLKICRVEIPALAPISLLRLAELYFGQDRNNEGIKAIDSLVAQYPEAYYSPYGLKLKADNLMHLEGRRDEADKIYRHLLEDFSTYPFSAEIRDILRRQSEVNQL